MTVRSHYGAMASLKSSTTIYNMSSSSQNTTAAATPTTTAGTSNRPLAPGRVDSLIRSDHSLIKKLHQDIKRASDPVIKQRYCHELIRTISLHSVAEEIVVYPVLEKRQVYSAHITNNTDIGQIVWSVVNNAPIIHVKSMMK